MSIEELRAVQLATEFLLSDQSHDTLVKFFQRCIEETREETLDKDVEKLSKTLGFIPNCS